jgi:hypothetical protein
VRTAILLLAAAGALALGGCNNRNAAAGTTSAGNAACKAFGASATAPVGADAASVVDDCLHRWGYTLARSTDAADTVSLAVVAACSAPLSRWNQQNLAVGGGAPEAPSLLTGENTTPIGAHAEFARSRALFYVVQARAGKCPPPKVEARDVATASSPDR